VLGATPAPIATAYQRDRYLVLDAHGWRRQTEAMATAILMGATSGAVHAVTGPDHLLSLGSAAMSGMRRAFRVGLFWGLGHGIGTLLLAIPFFLLSRTVGLEQVSAYSERIAGVALMATALWTLTRASNSASSTSADTKAPAAVGLFHGVTGASALVLMLPAVVHSNPSFTVVFLVAFAIGSTLAMAVLTATIGLVGHRLRGPLAMKAQRATTVGALVLGAAWTFGL
jgi:nickel/cobalt transporter (NicO) family protein